MEVSLFVTAFGIVFIAEVVGDKAIYTISTFSTRYHVLPIFLGIVPAFMGKMLVAVQVGRVIAQLPVYVVAATSAATFFTIAVVLWLKGSESELREDPPRGHWSRGSLLAFAAIFFSEWGDVGQIAAATLSSSNEAPVTIWLAATLAMVAKGVLAMILGVGLKTRVPPRVLRYGAVGVYLVMGISAVVETVLL